MRAPLTIEDPCSELRESSTVTNAVFFMIRSLLRFNCGTGAILITAGNFIKIERDGSVLDTISRHENLRTYFSGFFKAVFGIKRFALMISIFI
jgi:hypothetical protein